MGNCAPHRRQGITPSTLYLQPLGSAMTIIKHNKGEVYEKGMPMTWPKYASTKLDGIRVSGQNGTLITNSGKEIPNKELIAKFAPLVQGLDGELIYGEANHELVYNRTNSVVMRKNNSSSLGVTLHVFDTLDLASRFETRLASLANHTNIQDVVVLQQTLLHSESELDDYYASCLASGYEGVILRNPSAIYKQGRSTALSGDLLKLKPFRDSEAEVLSVYEAMHNANPATLDAHGNTTRTSHQENLTPLGMVGGYIVRDIHSGVEFNCAPGRSSHNQRTVWWSARQSLVGKVLKYRYLDIGTLNKPRLNGFLGWRDELDL